MYISTVFQLGIANVARVAIYRACKRSGIFQWLLPPGDMATSGIRTDSSHGAARPPAPWADRKILCEADDLLKGRMNCFSAHAHHVGNPPDWFLNPFENKRHPQPSVYWSKIADFCDEAGDIKGVWEISRFGWATVFARAWRITGDARYPSALQAWMQDWCRQNPPNTGPNWMCGQETSVRLMNALLAFQIAGLKTNVDSGLMAFVEAHCRRIDLTTLYAVAQDNNHATSEAAALFVGGAWLAQRGDERGKRRGRRWSKKGRQMLERRILRLILTDGSFSQHSLTYHRMALDTLSVAEAWRRHYGEAPFTTQFYTRAAAATRWLGAVIDPASGDGPNLGANDGTHPYHLDASAYRDFRPSLQLASLLFTPGAALPPGPWDESAAWLGAPVEGAGEPWLKDLSDCVFADGGYVVMRNRTGARVLLRAPTARFRPSHADALHVDLWWKGRNLLRDGGTYSYAEGGSTAMTLASVAGHNIPQFDDHDQMPRLGRFLYGNWVRVDGAPAVTKNCEGQSWAGSYTDYWGTQHRRAVNLKADGLRVTDYVCGFQREAVWRWRLAPGDWLQNDVGCASSIGQIRVESDVPIRRLELKDAWESRHYLEKSVVPVLEVAIDQSPAVLTTTIAFS